MLSQSVYGMLHVISLKAIALKPQCKNFPWIFGIDCDRTYNLGMNDSSPEEQEPLAQWEAEQSDRLLNRTAQLETELIIADQKLHALRAFMAEARSHEGN